MNLNAIKPRVALLILCALFWGVLAAPRACSAEKGNTALRPPFPDTEAPLTLRDAVRLAESSYPKVLQDQAEVRAAKRTVSLQRIKEYVPDSMLSYQDVVATHNRVTQTLFGSAVLPTTPGPGPESVRMNPNAFSAAGFIIDWAPLDFGLHKARIGLAKSNYDFSKAQYGVTVLDVTVQAAARYLEALVMQEQVSVAQANVGRFAEFSSVVHAQVEAGLKPGADASLADAQLANARNDLIRARLNDQLARAALAYAVGRGGRIVELNPGAMVQITQPDQPEKRGPIFENHPLAVAGKAQIATVLARKHVLDKEYYPKFRFLAGANLRGTTFGTNRGDVEAPGVSGIFPVVPNYNLGMMIDLPVFDVFRIHQEKKVVLERVTAAQQAYALVLQGLKTDDVQARATVRASMELAANMPVQVAAADHAAKQAQARYEAGLASVAEVAEANQLLADSRVKEAVANVGVWKALLAVSSVYGDIQPFVSAADSATRRERR